MEKIKKIDAERNFLSLLLKNKELISDWSDSGPQKEHFTEDHHLLIEAIRYAFNEGYCLTRKMFVAWLQANCHNKSEIPTYEAIYSSINLLSPKKDDFIYYKKLIVDEFVADKTVSAIRDYQKNITSGNDVIMAAKRMHSNLADIFSDVVDAKPIVYEQIAGQYSNSFLDQLKVRKDQDPEQYLIKCGIREIDEVMVTGFAPGSMTLFCGDVGSFKTGMMLNVAANVWERQYPVLFVPLEMSRDRLYQKFLSRQAKVEFSKIQNPKYLSKEEWERVEFATHEINKNGSPFFIMEKQDGRLSISNILKEIERHVDIVKPRLVVIDYIGILKIESSGGKKSERNDLEIGEMLKDLNHMGRAGSIHEHGFANVSGVQIGREGLKRIRRLSSDKVTFHSEDLRGSHEYSADAWNIFAQMPDPVQSNSRLNIYKIKSRFGGVFPNGQVKASLNYKPEVCFVESINDDWIPAKRNDIIEKMNDNDLDDSDFDFNLDDKPLNVDKKIKAPSLCDSFDDMDDIEI